MLKRIFLTSLLSAVAVTAFAAPADSTKMCMTTIAIDGQYQSNTITFEAKETGQAMGIYQADQSKTIINKHPLTIRSLHPCTPTTSQIIANVLTAKSTLGGQSQYVTNLSYSMNERNLTLAFPTDFASQ